MALRSDVRARVTAFRTEVDRLRGIEFPHEQASRAVERLDRHFVELAHDLDSLRPDADAALVKQTCCLVLRDLRTYLPILGFLLRATDVRNAFELVGPLERLTSALFGSGAAAAHQVALVLSSEWDDSPYTYHHIHALDGFVLIGFPAPESSNPLLTPLAGHEMAHPVWRRRMLGDALRPIANAAVDGIAQAHGARISALMPSADSGDLFRWQLVREAAELAIRQAQEVFCDFVGVRLFGVAYLRAFAYLLAPGATTRSPAYPTEMARSRLLVHACKALKLGPPTDYVDAFQEPQPPTSGDRERLRLDLADAALAQLVDELLRRAREVVDDAGIPMPNDRNADEIVRRFELGVPYERASSLADIIVAAWRAHDRMPFWPAGPHDATKQEEILREIVLKSIEVYDIEVALAGA